MRNININKKRTDFRILIFVLIALFVVVMASIISSYVVYLYFSHDLPDLTEITGYKPRLVTEVYSSDGTVIGEFFTERRKLVSYEEVPPQTLKAFIAIEDKRFFEHEGFDFRRIAGALIKNIESVEIVQGASTITQQVAKNLVLSPERSFSRKIKEAILAYRMENNLSKEEILYVYLNHIYLGDGAYGIEAASQNYFGRPVSDTNLAEAALLAALPKAPEYYSPRRHFERVKSRQELVLETMRAEGFITEEQKEKAGNYKIEIAPKRNINMETAPYFVEIVRQYLIDAFGSEAFANGGYSVFTTADADLSLEAGWVLRRGIIGIETRRGRGLVSEHLTDSGDIERFKRSQEVKELEEGKSYQGVVTDIAEDVQSGVFTAAVAVGKRQGILKFASSSPFGSPLKNMRYPVSGDYAPLNGYPGISLLYTKLRAGDVITVKVRDEEEEEGLYLLSPDFAPQTQGALLAMDTGGYVKAVVGGFDFRDSQFNRATQASRQPGSSFKPMIYAAAIDKGYTETTIVYDVPLAIKNWVPQNYDNSFLGAIPFREALSQSRNLASIRIITDIDPAYAVSYAERFGFSSRLNPFPSLALGGSEVRLIEMVKAFNVFASGGKLVEPRFILRIYDRDGRLVEDNTAESYVSNEEADQQERERKRMEILRQIAKKTNSYTPKTQSDFIEEKNISKDFSFDGDREFQTSEEFLRSLQARKPSDLVRSSEIGEQAINPDTAYIMTDLLRSVVKEGTGRGALKLTKLAPVAGKTGTTNDFADAWFVGFSPKLAAGVWIGTDDHKPIGKGETGGKAALPIWVDFMEGALEKFPGGDFRVPDGIRFVSTPYGFIPYKTGSEPDGEELGVTSNNYGDDGYGSEIDFLLRR